MSNVSIPCLYISKFSTEFAFKSGLTIELTTVGCIPNHHKNPFKPATTVIAKGDAVKPCSGICNISYINSCIDLSIDKNTPFTNKANPTTTTPGINDENDLETIGGTFSGNLITKFFLTINL